MDGEEDYNEKNLRYWRNMQRNKNYTPKNHKKK